jgi:hypothetical protein
MSWRCFAAIYITNWTETLFFRFICTCVVKPLAGQTAQTWHSLACAVKTEGKTVRVWGPWGWVHTCNVTAYRNTVSWQCGRDSCPPNVSKVGYAVTLRACSVCCRYLAVASKGWHGYGRSRCGRATCNADSVQQPSTYAKPEAASAVLGSWWWAVCRPKHVELNVNMK